MSLGPVQILVVGFQGNQFRGEILEELRRLREDHIVRLLDLLVVAKDGRGSVRTLEASDLPSHEAAELGAVVRSLIDFPSESAEPSGAAASDDEETWDVIDAIPENSAAAIVLLEHRWAIPLRDAILRAGGMGLADAWVHQDDLVATGLDGAGAGGSAGLQPSA